MWRGGWMDGRMGGRLSPSASLLRAPYGANKKVIKGIFPLWIFHFSFLAEAAVYGHVDISEN